MSWGIWGAALVGFTNPAAGSAEASPTDPISENLTESRNPGSNESSNTEPDTTDAVSKEEIGKIEAALAADAEASSEAETAQQPAIDSQAGATPSGGSRTPAAVLVQRPANAASLGVFANTLGGLELSLIADVAGSIASRGALAGTGAHDPAPSGFSLQQLELHAGANVDQVFRFETNIVFGLGYVEIEEAVASTIGLGGGVRVRLGQFLTRFGKQNASHPHQWNYVEQPLVLGKFFGAEGARGLGVEVSWLTPLPWFVEVLGAVQAPSGSCCLRSFSGGETLAPERWEDLVLSAALRQFHELTPNWSLFWGLSYISGASDAARAGRSEVYGGDVYVRWRPPANEGWRRALTIHAEGMHRRRQVPGDVWTDQGGFASVTWNFRPRLETGARAEWVQGRENDPLDPEWSDARTRLSSQFTFYPSHFSRLRLQAGAQEYGGGKWSFVGLLNLEVLVGSHGAHDY